MKNCSRFLTGKCLSPINPQPLDNFNRDKKKKDGLTVWCKSCAKQHREDNKESRNALIRKWHKDHPEKVLASRRKHAAKNAERTREFHKENPDYTFMRRYGITRADYDALYAKQNGRCALCGRHSTEFKKQLHVDHCHKTKKVRGLLCSVHNQALGMFQDDTALLGKAINYLDAHKS